MPFHHVLCVAGSAPSELPPFPAAFTLVPIDDAGAVATQSSGGNTLLTVVMATGDWELSSIKALRTLAPSCFIAVWHQDAVELPRARILAFQAGAK